MKLTKASLYAEARSMRSRHGSTMTLKDEKTVVLPDSRKTCVASFFSLEFPAGQQVLLKSQRPSFSALVSVSHMEMNDPMGFPVKMDDLGDPHFRKPPTVYISVVISHVSITSAGGSEGRGGRSALHSANSGAARCASAGFSWTKMDGEDTLW